MPSSQNDIGVYSNALTPTILPVLSFAVPAATVEPLPTIPNGVNIILLQPDQPIRYVDNGVDDPDTTTGILIPANVPFQYQVVDFKLIRFHLDAGATGDATVNLLGYSYAKAKEN